MKKLIVQIPCYQEEGTLAETVAAIPRIVPGVQDVEILVVDDGSTDRTVEVARAVGVDYIVRHTANLGLARAFATGLDAALRLGADVIVNTDADNQYAGRDVAKLVAPILAGEADVVIGDRQTADSPHLGFAKRRLQRLGSVVVRRLSGLQVPDAVSGFRAISRAAALQINIVSSFSYTIEMLIQAGHKGMAVASVPVGTNPVERRSRLFRSVPEFISRSLVTMVRVYAMYHPMRFFAYLGLLLLLVGAAPIARFLFFYFQGAGSGHVQSLILGGALAVIGCVTILFGLLADLIGSNRRLVEMTLERVRRLELGREGQEEGELSTRARRSLVPCLLVALGVSILACGPREATTGGERFEVPGIGVAVAEVPSDCSVERWSIVCLSEKGTEGILEIEAGAVPERGGVNLVALANAQKGYFDGRAEGEFFGNRELVTPMGPAYTARGRFRGEEGPVEEIRALLLHPTENRPLVVTFRYPGGDDTDQRLEQLMHVLGDLGPIEPPAGAPAAPQPGGSPEPAQPPG